ncbi:MAG: glutathione S-transferase N-terminal domain-containing protein, partial [Alphaproteobacteria bacterium]|nr:glutathione S-transferase N-terminal domain-containing protein [Alphaproteobacteria bacterium]
MKLFISANSPYVRIVRVLLREIGNRDAVEEIETDPRSADSGFWSLNPVARIPALQLSDGTVIGESDLICRHLDDRMADGQYYLPLSRDPSRLSMYAIARGMLDRGVAARTEILRPAGPDRDAFVEAQFSAVRRSADALERMLASSARTADIFDITLACTTAWLDFRHPGLTILQGRPRLAEQLKTLDQRQSMA